MTKLRENSAAPYNKDKVYFSMTSATINRKIKID